jgi:adenylate cyclase
MVDDARGADEEVQGKDPVVTPNVYGAPVIPGGALTGRAGNRGRTKAAVGVAIGLVAALLATLLARSPFVDAVELITYDWRMRLTARPDQPGEDVVLVSIDDDSVRRLAPLVGRWPWPRLLHASLVDYLTRAPARAVVYDVLFTEPDVRRFDVGDQEWTGRESDQAFAESVAKAGNVVLAADAAAEGLVDPSRAIVTTGEARPARTYARVGSCVEDRALVVPPIAMLDRAARSVGHTLLVRDPDGPLRRHSPFVRAGDRVVPSLAMAAVLVATNDAASPPASGLCPPFIPYRGPTLGPGNRPTFIGYSFYDLYYSEEQIAAGEKPLVDPAVFKDKIVVVSATASGTYEVQASPFEQGIAGGEVHASIIDGLLRGRSIEPVTTGITVAATFGLALAIGVAGGLVGMWPLAILALTAAACFVWIGVRLLASGTLLPVMPPVTAVALAFVGQLAWQYFVEGREKRQVKRLFSRYVPREVYQQLLDDPTRAALGGKRRTMTVLFSDVRGFTAMSEKSTPEEVVGQLNDYFSRMVDVLFEHHGTLDKFVGDMVMGLFGAPLDDADHAEHAVQAALAMTRALDDLNRRWRAAGRPVLDIGIGISTGDMVAGNIGSNAIMSYTVIGDVVNLGARLESLNKEYGTRIIISEATRQALKGRYDVRPLGEVLVKGKSRPVAIYEVQ